MAKHVETITVFKIKEMIVDNDENGKKLVKKAILLDNIEIVPESAEAIGRIDLHKPDWTLTSLKIDGFWGKYEHNQGGVDIHWSAQSAGCGRIVIHINNEGKLMCDSQCLSREFVKSVLCQLVDQMEFDNE